MPVTVEFGTRTRYRPGIEDLRGQARALAADRILRDLDQYRLTVLQDLLDPRRRALEILRRVVHLAGVQDPVAAATDVDERSLHPGSTFCTRPR